MLQIFANPFFWLRWKQTANTSLNLSFLPHPLLWFVYLFHQYISSLSYFRHLVIVYDDTCQTLGEIQASTYTQTLVCGGECERVKQRETETRKCVSERIMMPQGSHLPSWCPAHSRSPCDPEPWGSPCPWAHGSGSARSCRGTWPAQSPSASGPRCPVDTNTITWPPHTPFSCWYWLAWVSCSCLCWNMGLRVCLHVHVFVLMFYNV